MSRIVFINKCLIKAFYLFALLTFLSSCAAKISSKKAVKELEFVNEQVLYYHPLPYFYVDSLFVDSVFREKKNKLMQQKRIKKNDVFIELLEYVSVFRDGHLQIMPTTYKELQGLAFGNYFPLDLVFDGGIITVEQNYSDCQKIERGMRIISIDDQKASNFAENLRKRIPTENLKTRDKLLSRGFPYRYWLLNGNSKKYTVKFIDNNNDTLDKILKSIPVAKYNKLKTENLQENFRKYFEESNGTFYFETDSIRRHKSSYFYLLDSVGYFRMRSFSGNEQELQLIHKNMKTAIETKIPYLIIDLRGNFGGRTRNFEEFLQYFNRDTIYQTHKVITKNLKENIELVERMKTDTAFRKKIVSKTLGDTLTLYAKEDFMITDAYDTLYEGSLIVLIDEGSFSAGSGFAILIKNNGLGLLVGHETGGFTNSFADPFFIKLKRFNSLLIVQSKLIVQGKEGIYEPLQPDINVDWKEILDQPIDSMINFILSKYIN
ncbi:MAG: S41 family peptidase [Lentimicrobiaceae bacterium]|jgi:muconolactone delta-isomerase|nr:S41 family peptidase [Lentimicrobiaceae bacterium]